MHFLLPRFPMLDSPHPACYARIMPKYAQVCQLNAQRRAGKMPNNAEKSCKVLHVPRKRQKFTPKIPKVMLTYSVWPYAEVRRLKNLKRQEITDKMAQIAKVGGLAGLDAVAAANLTDEFDPVGRVRYRHSSCPVLRGTGQSPIVHSVLRIHFVALATSYSTCSALVC